MPALAPARVALLSYAPAAGQTWSGTAATITITATSGTFTPGPVTWVGNAATITVTATSGAFTPGAVTWVGNDATITITATSGSWVAPQTWVGNAATITITATSGTWVQLRAGYVCLEVDGDYVTLTVSEDC